MSDQIWMMSEKKWRENAQGLRDSMNAFGMGEMFGGPEQTPAMSYLQVIGSLTEALKDRNKCDRQDCCADHPACCRARRHLEIWDGIPLIESAHNHGRRVEKRHIPAKPIAESGDTKGKAPV